MLSYSDGAKKELKRARAGEWWGGAPSDKGGRAAEAALRRHGGGESSSQGREQQVQRLRGWEELPPQPQERPQGLEVTGEVEWDWRAGPDPAEPMRLVRSWDSSPVQRAAATGAFKWGE